MSALFENFKRCIAEHLQAESVILVDDEKTNDLICSSFPFAGSKIDWEKVPGSIEEEAGYETFVRDCLGFFQRAVSNNDISQDDSVLVMGDNQMNNLAVATAIGTLEQILEDLLDIPQHTYIVAQNGDWCMTFTMEGDMTFGRSCRKDF